MHITSHDSILGIQRAAAWSSATVTGAASYLNDWDPSDVQTWIVTESTTSVKYDWIQKYIITSVFYNNIIYIYT